MIYQSPKNPNAHQTVKERKWPSYPTKQLLQRGLIQGKVLDFGCGLGKDIGFLRNKGFHVVGYDPHYAPDYPTEKFDTILCHYVLNVLLPEEQTHVLLATSELIKPTGNVYFTVRRDVKRNGFRWHVKRHVKTYQCNVKLPYPSVMQTEFCEIYGYQHLNQRGLSTCLISPKQELLTESATAYAVVVPKSLSNGHCWVIPKSSVQDYFTLSTREKQACWLLVDRVKYLIEQQNQPQSYTVGFNTAMKLPDVPPVRIEVIPHY